MDKRIFIGYLTPVAGGIDRDIEVSAINYGEAEGLLAEHLTDGEFISSISQDFPKMDLTEP